jgi:hypothetical protein
MTGTSGERESNHRKRDAREQRTTPTFRMSPHVRLYGVVTLTVIDPVLVVSGSMRIV